MNWPVYNFNDLTLDYAQVEITNMRMYSYLNNEIGCCCSSKSLEGKLCTIDNLMQATYIDGNEDINLYNEDRYKADVKAAYLLLYNLV